jgi:hypothetical protein
VRRERPVFELESARTQLSHQRRLQHEQSWHIPVEPDPQHPRLPARTKAPALPEPQDTWLAHARRTPAHLFENTQAVLRLLAQERQRDVQERGNYPAVLGALDKSKPAKLRLDVSWQLDCEKESHMRV